MTSSYDRYLYFDKSGNAGTLTAGGVRSGLLGNIMQNNYTFFALGQDNHSDTMYVACDCECVRLTTG